MDKPLLRRYVYRHIDVANRGETILAYCASEADIELRRRRPMNHEEYYRETKRVLHKYTKYL
jgi:hypothetical protein